MPEYEYLRLALPAAGDPAADRGAARLILTQHAEYGRWELQRVRVLPNGSRQPRTAPAVALV